MDSSASSAFRGLFGAFGGFSRLLDFGTYRNAMATVFTPEYEQVIKIHGYDRICRYYLEPSNNNTDDEAELLEENFGNDAEKENCF